MYVGSTGDFTARWKYHKRRLNARTHPNIYLQNAWNKYGENIFEFSIVEYADDLESWTIQEQYYTDLWKPEYAMRKECVISQLGTKRSEETKQKMRLARTGRPSNAKGKFHSEKAKKKMSESHKGKSLSEETKKKMSKALIGNTRTLGKHCSEETKLKIKQSWIKRREKNVT